MAPITATSLGSPVQTIDDVELIHFIDSLSSFNTSSKIMPSDQIGARRDPSDKDSEVLREGQNVDDLINEISKHQTWRFQEKVDLHQWVPALDAIDAALITLVTSNPGLILIGNESGGKFAESQKDVESVHKSVISSISIILRFLSSLLRNSTSSKSIFNSSDTIIELLGASDDNIADLAIEVLANLVSPPLAHHQQTPEVNQYSNPLAQSKASAHEKIMCVARGWGSKGSGLGLYVCVTADNSDLGQGTLPAHAGELTFDYYDASNKSKTIQLTQKQILSSESSKSSKSTKPTSFLFFECIQQAGGRDNIPNEKLFPLLAQIRLAKDFHTNASRSNAVERRLKAIICALNAHPSQEVLASYFAAQPELCVEIIDLLRPTISSSSVSSIPLSSSINYVANSTNSHSAISAIAESSDVPYRIKKIAVETLTALVSPRDGSNGGNPTRLPNVLQELGVGTGVGKGQYLGFLPTLFRFSLASLNTYLTLENAEKVQPQQQTSNDPVEFGIDLGFAFIDAIKAPARPVNEEIEASIEFIDSVLSLTAAVVSVPHGTASLTDCGLIPALVSTIALHSQMSKSRNSSRETYFDCQMNHICAQAIQIIDGAIATNSTALKVFLELKGIDLLVNRLYEAMEIIKHRGKEESETRVDDSDVMEIDSEEKDKNLEFSTKLESSLALHATDKSRRIDLLGNHLYGEKDIIKHRGKEEFEARLEDSDVMEIDLEEKDKNLEFSTKLESSLILNATDKARPLTASRRVLLFCIISCLNCLLHQQESTATTSSGGAQLRKKELTESLIDIMDNVTCYGGALTALAATLLSDVMNSDPQVVHHVHSSGLASAFLRMLNSKQKYLDIFIDKATPKSNYPVLPLTAELVMALPNVLSALSLTEDGAKLVKEANPFPTLLSIFYCPHYVMPLSNCLLNEMSAIVGSGLDELMRHVPSLRDLGINALVEAINRIVILGETLFSDESSAETDNLVDTKKKRHLENERTCLMQYAYNISQLLEQILHNEVLAEPFMEAGGLVSLLKLYPYLMPFGRQFLSHISCLSNPATANITHSTTTNAITLTIKCIASNYDSQKIIKIMANALDAQMDNLLKKKESLRISSSNGTLKPENILNQILDNIPNSPLHMIMSTSNSLTFSDALASFLREIVVIEWLVIILSSVIRAACQRSSEMGNGFIGRNHEKWKDEISSESFSKLIHKLSKFHCSAMFEVCRIRSDNEFEEFDSKRCQPKEKRECGLELPRYRLRIVCQEGAVVRDGIDIDSCSSVGSLQMGEVVEAFDRCINSSGVMRYHTARGWVSEQTRGHGREPIAEVISLHCDPEPASMNTSNVEGKELKRIEWEVPTLRAASASILGRLQNCQKTLFSCLSRAIVQGVRSLPTRWPQSNTSASTYTGSIIKLLTAHVKLSFEIDIVKELQRNKENHAAISLYLSTALELLHSCLYEEKRERRILNIPLLISIMTLDWKLNDHSESPDLPASGLFGAIRFILKHGLNDIAIHSKKEIEQKKQNSDTGSNCFVKGDRFKKESWRLSKPVAASLPPTINLLRRLASRSLIIDSQMSSVLSKTKTDLVTIIGEIAKDNRITNDASEFVAAKFARELHCSLADIALELWSDPRLICAPAHIIHPIVSFIGEILNCLEEAKKPLAQESSANRSFASRTSNDGSTRDVSELQDRVRALRSLSESMNVLFGVNASSRFSFESASGPEERSIWPPAPPLAPLLSSDTFEPSEEILDRLTEMGFSREHALEALETTQSNTLEEAMEHALAHPPSSPATIGRRNAAREERRQRRERTAAQRRLLSPFESSGVGETTETHSQSNVNSVNSSVSDSTSMERRNAAREERRQRYERGAAQRRLISQREVADVGETTETHISAPAESNSRQHNRLSQSNATSVNSSVSDSRSMEIDKKPADTSTKAEETSDNGKKSPHPSRAVRCLSQFKDKLHSTALNLIEAGSSGLSFKEHSLKELEFPLPQDFSRLGRFDEGHGFGDGESEAVTTVLCHFLLEVCSRYPSDRSELIKAILDRIKSHTKTKGSAIHIVAGHENDFGALCHAAVIIFRALPRTRVLFLAYGMHSTLIGCVRSFLSLKSDAFSWPIWLPSAMLLLDVFAQPTAAAIDLDNSKKEKNALEDSASATFSRKSEYSRASSERKKYSAHVSKVAREIFSTMNGNSQSSLIKKKRQKETIEKKNESKDIDSNTMKDIETSQSENKKDTKNTSQPSKRKQESFPPIPVYTPLMPQDEAEICMTLCIRILGLYTKHQASSASKSKVTQPPPGLVHACLLLLARILRSHRIASNCLRKGGAELLLSLPPQSRFVGNTSLVGVVLRHMVEDESTLRTSMETEIRTTVSRLHRQNQDASSRNSVPKVKAGSFIQAVIPLICRDSIVFLKAAATTVQVEHNFGGNDGRQASGKSAHIVLLSPEERAKNVKLLIDRFGGHANGQTNNFGSSYNTSPYGQKSSRSSSLSTTPNLKRGRARSSSDSKLPKSKNSHHSSAKRGTAPKRSKKEKHEKSIGSSISVTSGNFILLNGSVTNHIVSLLLTDLTKVAEKEQKKWNASASDAVSFLRACDYLEILSDLVLAVPACASAIHRYRPPYSNYSFPSKQHQNELSSPNLGNGKQTSTAITYLIYMLIPQERRNDLKDSDSHNVKVNDERWKSENEKKKVLYMRTKLAQSTSRLIVALCARAGEGRIRVISELASALRGKTFEQKSFFPHDATNFDLDEEKKMWALQSWAELCIGLAEPRSSGINLEKQTTPHFQVVKNMLEYGMGHALMDGISRINLHHPMASSVTSALMRPLEVLTRANVTFEVERIVKAQVLEAEKRNAKSIESESSGKTGKQANRGNTSGNPVRRLFPGSAQRSDNSFVDDNMLEDGFDPDTAERAQRFARRDARRRDIRRMNFHQFARHMDNFDNDNEDDDDDDDDDDDNDDVEMEELEEVLVTTEEDDESMGMEEDDTSDIDNEEVDELDVHLDEEDEEDGNDDDESSENSNELSESDESSDSDSDTSSSESEIMILDGQSDDSDQGMEDDEVEHENVNLVDLLGDEEDNDFFANSGGIDDDDDAGTGSEGELEEGWTRVNSSGFRGVLIGNRQFSNRSTEAESYGRRRTFIERIDRPDEMLGNIRDILHAPDMQRDTIQEIEEHLGIRILSNPRPTTNSMSRATRNNTSEDLNSYDRGAVGSVPSVYQPNALAESNHLSGYGPAARWNENSSMEYTYGSGMIRNEHLNLFSTNNNQYDVDSVNMPSVVNTQLFPGGTAAAMHSRAQQYLHPLLSDIELPPIHSVCSTVEPHSIRNNRTSHSDDGRLLGELSFGSIMASSGFLSGSNGNIIRLNRGSHWSRRPNITGNGSSAEARWTADGQPLDNTTTDFANAFEAVLQETIAREHSERPNDNESSSTNQRVTRPSTGESNVSNGNEEGIQNVTQRAEESVAENTSRRRNADVNNEEAQVNSNSSNETVTFGGNIEENNNGNNLPNALRPEPDANATVQRGSENQQAINQSELSSNNSNVEENNSEGEAVASSLAAGLRLSPRSESSAASLSFGEPSTAQTNAPNEASVASNSTIEHQAPSHETRMNANMASTGNESEITNVELSQDENTTTQNVSNSNGLTCPPGMDLEVFNSLPLEVQREVVEQHQATLMNVMEQLDSSSGLDPEALAALPEDMQREAIAQEQQERRREQTEPANPSNAQEMDNASFLASLSSPDLREEVLLSADEAFLNSLPPEIIAETQALRERRSHSRTNRANSRLPSHVMETSNSGRNPSRRIQLNENNTNTTSSSKRRQRTGKMQVKSDREDVIYVPPAVKEEFGSFLTETSMKTILRLIYLLSPISNNLLENLIQNLCSNNIQRDAFLTTFVSLLNDDTIGAIAGVNILGATKKDKVKKEKDTTNSSNNLLEEFPPSKLIGTAPKIIENDLRNNGMSRRKNGRNIIALLATYLPTSSRHSKLGEMLPPEVAKRIIETLTFLAAKSTRICLSMLVGIKLNTSLENPVVGLSGLELLMNLFDNPLYSRSSTNLEQLLILIDSVVAPLKDLPKLGDAGVDISKKDLDAATAARKEWVMIPQPQVSHQRLQSLCSVLRLETCKDSSFQKVNMIARRLCRVQENRSCVLRELAYVAQTLGIDAIRDLKMLGVRLNDAVMRHKGQPSSKKSISKDFDTFDVSGNGTSQELPRGTPGSAVALSTSTSELKLLRVLQTLQSLCAETNDEYSGKKNESHLLVTQEMLTLIKSIDLSSLWDELMSCLKFVLVLEGVSDLDADEKKLNDSDEVGEGSLEIEAKNGKPRVKKLQNSAAGLLTRFLPTIEAFFLVNASHLADGVDRDIEVSNNNDPLLATLVDGERLVNFVSTNKVLLNALLRSNSTLLEKGMQSMIQVPQCRPFLDFDVKRHWFKTQLRRGRNSRRTLRLNIRRNHVFEDTYHQLRLRNADELKSRLHITFSNEEGVDAGGLSREFFGILAKEMFNPNYALFTSTEDGCTFQPNPNSSINPEHLRYFRCVGRIVGKAVVDGFLMDAHFTRSLYKHMLGVKPTHHDMQAIDPDFYKNLKMILEYNLDDIGLDHLTFSTEDHSFGRSQTIDLIPNGRNVCVTEESKEKYVQLVCQHRMTTSIQHQINAYLEGFYELVKPELISIFNAKELELLISGMPDIDMHDLRRNTDYQGYKATDREIGWFWNIMFSLKRGEKAAFLQFVTGSAKVPLDGFSQLQGMRGTQKFSIHKAGGSSGALMSAHTCFNALDLPVYKNEQEMRDKLIYAITEGVSGFMFA